MASQIKTPLSLADLEKVWGFSKPPLPLVNSTICQLIEVNFNAYPDAVALSSTWQDEITYFQLDQLTANLATFLLESGSVNMDLGSKNEAHMEQKRHPLIPILFEKSTWAVVAMVAILRAGAAFVPLDPNQPVNRRETVLRRTNAKLVLTSEGCASLVDQDATGNRNVVIVGRSLADELSRKYHQRKQGASSHLSPSLQPAQNDATAYVIFTSGSTGEPKGVVVDHATAASSCLALGARLGMCQGTRVVQFSAFTFDACIFEILGTLIWGGTVCILSENERVNSLAKSITALKAEVFVPLTPTVARSMSAAEVPHLRTICLGGEAVTQADIDRWTDVPHLLNVYGPTETCIICVANDIGPGVANELVLGQAFASATWVVDPEDHNVLVRPGQVGELLVEGILATEYFGQPKLTAEAFVHNPLWLLAGSTFRPGRKGRVYKTGDLVRHHPDGSGRLVFVGRKDSQVKIRGHRIELEDVEHHLRDCLPVSAAVAELITPMPGPHHFADDTRPILAAFLVGYENGVSSEVESSRQELVFPLQHVELSIQEASSLRHRLPSPMVPTVFFRIGHLPAMSSGKLDRKLLRALGTKAMENGRHLGKVARKEPAGIEPHNTQSLDRIWQLNHDAPPKPPSTATCLHHLFDKQAEMTPGSTAVCGWDGDFTYSELNRVSSIFASHLVTLGVGPNTVVPMIFATSSWAVVAILAILKVGAAFVGIDSRQLPERRNEMIERVCADVVLVSEDLAPTVSKSLHVKSVVTVSSETLHRLEDSGLDLFKIQDIASRSDAICYIIFTSGTTGTPKGVVTEHGAICTSVLAHITRMGVDNKSRVLQFSVCSFDACIMEIFPALASGGVVCVPSTAERTDGGLEYAVARMHVNFFIVTPSVSRLVKAAVTGCATVVLVGEVASASDLLGWGEQVRLLNGYGPTECSAGCVMHDIAQKSPGNPTPDQAPETSVIGKAVGCVTWVVNLDDQSKLVPFGAEGELFIEGSILARGYLDNEQTCAAFVNDPIWLSNAPQGHEGRHGRVYKTGDVVRYNTDGNLVYIGRRDSQIKLRGQRVELGDIERHLQNLLFETTGANNADIDAVVVEMVASPEQSVSRGTLVALFLLSHGKNETGSTAGSLIVKDEPSALWPFRLSAEQLARIAERLPQFMMPSIYLGTSRIPTTSAGKTDRRRLRELILSYLSDGEQSLVTGVLSKVTSTRNPSTEIECRLHKIWAQILGLEPGQFGVDCDFLRLGGDSLVAMHLCSMARKSGLLISSREILTQKTIARLARVARTVKTSPGSPRDYRLSRTRKHIRDEEDLDCSPFALSPIQKLYFDVNNQQDMQMEQSYYLEIKDTQLTYESLDAAFKAVISTHPMLRARFTLDGGTWRQTISPSVEGSYRLVRESLLSQDHVRDVFANSRASLNIQDGPIVSAVFFECQPQRLFMTISHLAVDTASWQIIFEDLTEFLNTKSISTPPQTRFPTWCERQAAYVSSHHRVSSLSLVSSPTDFSRSYLTYWGLDADDASEGSGQDGYLWSTDSFSLNKSDTHKLLTSCNDAYDTEPAMLLVAALVHSFIHVFTDRGLPHVFQEGHGRESWDGELDLWRTVGWFTTVYQIPFDDFQTIPGDVADPDLISDVVRCAKDAMKGLARSGWFDFTSRMLTTPTSKGKRCLADLFPVEVMFNYSGVSQTTGSTAKSENRIFSTLPIPDPERLFNKTRLSALIQVEAAVDLGRLQVDVHHNSNIRQHEKLAQWSRSFESTLKNMVSVLEGKQRDWTLVDFPGTFASYDSLDRFRKELLPGLAIKAQDIEDVFSMTPLQHGMYTSHLKDPGAYMLAFTFECSARDASTRVTVEQLCAAWSFVIQRHPLLRSIIIDALPGKSSPGFVVLRAPQATVCVKRPGVEALDTHISISQGCKVDLLHKLDVTLEENGKMKCCLQINHIVFDAHSKSLILRDMQNFLAGDRWPVAPSFRLFASNLVLDDPEHTERYWKTYLDGVEPCLTPTGLRGGTSGKVSIRTETLPGVPWALLKDFCRKHGNVTPANILELAWGWVLRGYTGSSTVCFSHLVSSRGSSVVDAETDEEVDDNEILGPLFGNLPVRIDFESSDTVLKTASIVNQTTLDGLSHQNTSLASIHHVLGIGAGRLSNSCVALEFTTLASGPSEEERSPLVIKEVSGYDPTDFDVLVSASILENAELQISINHQIELISQNDARCLGETLRHSLLWILQNPTITWEKADLVSPAHLAQIVTWNTPIPEITHGLLHQLVEVQVSQRPYASAIHAWDGDLSYTELDIAAKLIAMALRAKYRVRAGTLVPLIMEKSKWTMVGMLGILKAGGAFVPIATEPPGRMDRVLSQMPEATPVVTSQLYASLVGARVKEENLLLVEEYHVSHLVSASDPPSLSCSEDWAQSDAPAYVIFTSGTTGDPKGVVIEHASITTAILAQGRAFGYSSATRSYQFTSYTFDASITEIFATLSNGGCLCIPSETIRLDLDGTAEAIKAMHVNTCFFTPTLARLLQPSRLQCVTTLILGGEAVDGGLVDMWSHVPRVFCLYGPSEASICCASYEIRRHGVQDGIKPESTMGVLGCPIGKALASVSWIVDRNDHHKLAPLGAFGELVVEGPIVGKGYLNDDAKTESVFISDPRWLPLRPRSSRMYKTGDLVRYLPDGTLLFQGRKDSQVKINGQRIELGEVECHVRKVMPFEAACVVAEIVTLHSGGDDDTATAQKRTKKLVVVIGLEDGDGDDCDGHNTNGYFDSIMKPLHLSSEVFIELETRLPIYMVPSIFFAMPKDKIPTSASGKTDRKQLRNLVSSQFSTGTLAQVQREANNTVKRQPVTDVERQLQTIWAEVLGQDTEAIGLDDTFFRVGGTSLTAMTVTRQANHKFGLGVLFSHLVKGLTLGELAAKCKKGNAKQSDQDFITPFSLLDIPADQVSSLREDLATKLGIDESQVEDCFPCTPLQEGLMSMTEQNPGAYVARHVFILSNELDLVTFREAWDVAAQSAPILRSRILYSHLAKAFLQVVVREKTQWATQSGVYNAGSLPVVEDDTLDAMGLGTYLTHCTVVTDKESRQSWLVWTIHHSLYDGYSLPLIMDLVTRAYHGLEPGPVQPKPLQFLLKHTKALDSAVANSWWTSYLSNLSAMPFPRSSDERPLASPEETATRGTGGLERIVKIPPKSNKPSTEVDIAFSTMIHAAWALVISKLTGSNDVVFGAMLPGRHHERGDGLELDNVIGPTLALVPVRIIVKPGQKVRQLLDTVQSQAMEMSKFEQVGIQNLAKLNRDTQLACDFQTLVSVQPAAEQLTKISLAQGLWEWCNNTTPVGRGLEEYGLTLQILVPEGNGDLIVKANFDSKLISSNDMSTTLDHFVRVMGRLLGMQASWANTTLVSDILTNIDTAGACGLPITVTRPKGLVPSHPEPTHKTPSKTVEDEAVHFDHDRRPSTLVERLLQQLWAEVLGIEPHLISLDDSFVRLGGDSVLAMKLASLAREYHLQITPREVLGQSKTIAFLANLIEEKKKTSKSNHVQHQHHDGTNTPEKEAGNPDFSGSRCSLNIDVHQLETLTLPKLGISTDEVEDVFPCSPLQEGIVLSQVSHPELYWNSLVFDVVSTRPGHLGVLSPGKMHHAWDLVVQRHAMLRALLVEALPGRTEPGFVVLKSLHPKVSHLRVPEEIAAATCMDVEYFRRLNSTTTAITQTADLRQHYLTICEVYTKCQAVDRLVICLYFNHVILDGHSQLVLMNDLRAAYTGTNDLPLAPSYSQFIAHTKGAGSIQAEAEALAHWRRFMASVEPCILSAQMIDEPEEGQISTLHVCNVPRDAVVLFHHNSDATTATLVQAAWAMTLQRFTGLYQVVFGVGSSLRDMLEVSGITEMVGPIISLLLCQVDFTDASITARHLLHQVSSDIQGALPHQNSASLAKVLHEMGYNGVRNRLFNTAINLHSPGLKKTSDMHEFDIDIVPRASQDVTEFDVTLSSADTMDGLHVSMNYKSGYMSSHQALKVSTVVAETISWITQNLDVPISKGRLQDPMHHIRVMRSDDSLPAAGAHTRPSKSTRSGTPGPTMRPVEAQLQRLFCRALNLPEEQVIAQDDFFRLGGDSVAAIQISSWARSKGLDITVRDIMTRRTIVNLASLIPEHPTASTRGPTNEQTTQAKPSGSVAFPLAPLQSLYFDIQGPLQPGENFLGGFDQSILLRLARPFSLSHITEAFKALVQLHPMLRARISTDGLFAKTGRRTQAITADVDGSYRVRRVSLPLDPESMSKAIAGASIEARERLNATDGPILTVVLFEGGGFGQQQRIFMAIHHLMVDLVSWRIILRDLEEFLTTGTMTMSPTSGYPQWCQSLAMSATSRLNAGHFRFLRPRASQFSYWGIDTSQNTMGNMISRSFVVDSQLTAKLLAADGCNAAFGTNMPILLIAALISSFRLVFHDRREPVIWNEQIGRDPLDDETSGQLDVSGTVGWFTSLAPVEIDGYRDVKIADVVRRVKDCIMTPPPQGWHRWLASEIANGDLSIQWPAEVMFNYLGLFQQLERPDALFTRDTSSYITGLSSRESHVKQFSIIDATASIKADQSQRLEVCVRYNRHLKHLSKVEALIDTLQQTIESMVPVLEEMGQKTPQWTLSDFPGVFSQYDDIEKFRNHTVPTVLRVPPSEVEDVLLLSSFQQGIFLSQAKDPESYHTAIIMEFSDASDDAACPVDLVKLTRAWQSVVGKHTLLRAILVESLPGNGLPGLVVQRAARCIVRNLEQNELCSASTDNFRSIGWWRQYYDPVQVYKTGLQHHLTLAEHGGNVYACLEVNHMIVDAASTSVLLRDWKLAYEGHLDSRVSSYRQIGHLNSTVSQFTEQGKEDTRLSYWRDQLQGLRPCLLPVPDDSWSESNHRQMSRQHCRVIATSQLSSIRTFCNQNGYTVANVLQTAWALTLTALTGRSTAIFGHAVSAQPKDANTTLSATEDYVGPVIRLVPCRVHFYDGTETIAQVLERVRDDSAQDVPNQDVTLASITNILQVPRLFNTALTVETPVMKHHKGLGSTDGRSRLEIRQIGGYDPSEFDVTINAVDDGETLNVHVVYRDSDTDRGNQAAHHLAGIIRKALVDIAESHDPATDQIGSILKEIINMKHWEYTQAVEGHQGEVVGEDLSQPESNAVSPRTEMEHRLQVLCAKVIGTDPETINLHNDFFSIGGDSAAAMQVVAEAYRTGVAITVRQVLSTPTLAALADMASFHQAKSSNDYQAFSLVNEEKRSLVLAELQSLRALDRTSALQVDDILPTTDLQAYCVEKSLTSPSLGHNYVCFDIDPRVDICEERIEAACRSVMRQFSLLRTVFVRQPGRLWQVVLSEKESLSDNVPVLQRCHVGELETLDEAYNAVCSEGMNKSQIETQLGFPKVTFMLFEKTDEEGATAGAHNEYKFVMRLSHAQYDGVSLPLMLRTLADAYNGAADISPTVPFGAFIAHVSHQEEQSLAFWRRKLQGATMTRILPKLLERRRRHHHQGSICASEEVLNPAGSGHKRVFERVSLFLNTSPPAGRVRYTSATLVAAAWALVLSTLTDRRDVVFGQVVAGRNARLPHMHEVCGPTSTILPLRVRFGDEWVAPDLLRHVQEQSTGVGEFDAPLGLWRDVLGELRRDDVGLVGDTIAADGGFPFETVLLHQSSVEEEQLVCPFGKGTVAKPTLWEQERVPPYICIKSKVETHNTESSSTNVDSEEAHGHIHRYGRRRELIISIEAPSTKMDSQTATYLIELLGDAVSALSGENESTLAEIKSRLGSR